MDVDGDGLSNGEEALHYTSPILADTDGDGLSDCTVLTWRYNDHGQYGNCGTERSLIPIQVSSVILSYLTVLPEIKIYFFSKCGRNLRKKDLSFEPQRLRILESVFTGQESIAYN